jgi:MFS family permease
MLIGKHVDAVSKYQTIYLPALGAIAPWRLTFLLIGLPGLPLALLVRTIKEAKRRNLLQSADGQPLDLTLNDVFQQLLRRWRSMGGICIGMVLQSICGVAFFAWMPTFFQRVHGWTAGQAGRGIGVATLILCTAGMYVGGRLSDSWQRKGVWEGPLRVAVLSSIGIGISLIGAVLVPGGGWAIVLAGVTLFFIGLPTGSVYAAIQKIFPNQMRGQVSAVFFMTLNLGGMVLGALLPGLFNDYVFRDERMIGFSLALKVGLSSVIMLVIFPMTYGYYRSDSISATKIVIPPGN